MFCKHAHTILNAVDVCASLECCISLALTAREHNWQRPLLVDEPVIDVEKARHPLAELFSTQKFVENPIRSGCAQTKVKLIIGPNASGKSVYLKQVGIIAFLAHIGSFVPAHRAIIGPINRILTRMYSVDCVLDGMSSFTKDIAQMAACLHRSTQQSLIIIDEFGKGTLTISILSLRVDLPQLLDAFRTCPPQTMLAHISRLHSSSVFCTNCRTGQPVSVFKEVGLSLLASSLNYWIDQGKDSCPHIFASSHFHSLVNFLHRDVSLLSYHTLEVLENNGHLEFQYQLVDGIIDCSFALYTAEIMGVPKAVIKRSLEIYQVLNKGKTLEVFKADDWETAFLKNFRPLVNIFLNWDIANDCKGFLNQAACAVGAKDADSEEDKKLISNEEEYDSGINNLDGFSFSLMPKSDREGMPNERNSQVLQISTKILENSDAKTSCSSESFENSKTSSILKRKKINQVQSFDIP